ncbi:uncharacterized protein LOC105233092 isoform X4 [Bactrocera dorsalis]|uniref:Uncharacterized protein LOC105233092 isoform X3 n=1 Tax=Bactrocera dorsalis TaxID=27457 RepID=A0ABM3JEC2_BACDO|nr:uncharacterized protein LOC105233092 isoform X3 [Bactrocera dorsalis]XP_049307578.1 uncharacterized protein LOC105233092 isoform X4 [Bactrocera dorsalis]
MEFSFPIDTSSSENISSRQRDGEEMGTFRVAEPHSQRMATQLQHNISGDTASVLQKIIESLGRIESRQEDMRKRQEDMIKRLSALENALAEKMPERAEIQAQGQLLRECKVLSAKTHRCVSRITGEGISEEQILLQSLFPMSSEETLLKVEEHLTRQDYSDAMTAIAINLKSTKDSIEKVLQSLFSDELVWLYNYDGKAGKKALNKLKIVDITLGFNNLYFIFRYLSFMIIFHSFIFRYLSFMIIFHSFIFRF